VLVVREDGSPCAPGEPGELVHRGSLVALGYWNDPAKTAERLPPGARPEPWPALDRTSGLVRRYGADADEEGFLYFIGRKDDMIKTSGYRVSPTEIEEVLYGSGQVAEAAALGYSTPERWAKRWSQWSSRCARRFQRKRVDQPLQTAVCPISWCRCK
jgi:acyl-CoA synthetase (AMP-forming)/AMP-acid ligase II